MSGENIGGVAEMPSYKYSFVFEYLSGDTFEDGQFHKAGWTESFYWDDIQPVSVAAAVTMAGIRAQLLPRFSRIVGLRIGQVDPPGPSSTRALNLPGSNDNNNVADIPQMALLVDLAGSGVVNKSRYRIAAIPDNQVRAGEYHPTAQFRLRMLNYLEFLNDWKFSGIDLTKPLIVLKDITVDGVYTTESDLTVGIGNTVRIRGAETPFGGIVNGDFVVDAVATLRTGTLRNWTHGPTVHGKIRHKVQIFPQILAPITINRVVARKVGRPFQAYVGRQRRRRR
jgi:hypothetical protein